MVLLLMDLQLAKPAPKGSFKLISIRGTIYGT